MHSFKIVRKRQRKDLFKLCTREWAYTLAKCEQTNNLIARSTNTQIATQTFNNDGSD